MKWLSGKIGVKSQKKFSYKQLWLEWGQSLTNRTVKPVTRGKYA